MQRLPAVGRRLWSASLAVATAFLLVLFAADAIAAQAGAAAADAPTAVRDLPRGHTLTVDDIAGADQRQPTAGGDLAMAGWVTRRAIRAGEPLREPAVAPAPVIRAGEPVEAIWRQGGLELRVRGVALANAVAGQRVAVRLDTRRRLEGTAAGPGQVLVSPSTIGR
jgi:flagellar basal body P-ring formation protein FlgA